ncbi:hypothetical protein SAMN05216412_101212 [Nitrosospira multiformis]|uniref:Uncharacterized protein n=1 Tax=Nitrosospira multiformis TaxID=1231 RepID=A0A1H9YG49_9PROT|nr:hypothetical protein [Nitrosospira multiformis]SES67994.1 hypothetical protein SAMN05216412_101212 [Nitrosospira multiformis]
METAELLKQRLKLVYRWYQGMVNRDTGMLEYLYIPETDTFVREKSPIRDIASVWDVEMLSDFLNKHELRSLIRKSLRHYVNYLVERDSHLILDPDRLEEPSSIAHSAFMILALLHALSPRRMEEITALAEGILHQQRPDGSYKVYFHDLPDHGEELYAGEAMLALLETYRQLQDARCLQSVELAFSYYDAQYFRCHRVAGNILVFFANWQSQACRLLFECTQSTEIKKDVADYLCRMHDQIMERDFYENVERHPAQQVSVEVACALEGLNEAYAIVCNLDDKRTECYRHRICKGLTYLLELQCTDNGTEKERGGFGLTLQERAQRIDITGHAASAFIKSGENGIECRLPSANH